jgi:hypothetical protein
MCTGRIVFCCCRIVLWNPTGHMGIDLFLAKEVEMYDGVLIIYIKILNSRP